ncbi:MAG: hypothetical protein IT378_26030, partial [Sandaracinaceae bacterium]|nr:hypothetical protein [Sandaracinaceae bacterium]
DAERARALAVLRSAGLTSADARDVLRRGTVTLRAPITGVVRSLDAHPGESREPGGTPFARLIGRGPARIEVRSTEPLPSQAELTFEGTDGQEIPLASAPLSSVTDPVDGMRVAWLAPRDALELADGLRGRVRMRFTVADAWAVPPSALRLEPEGATLLRQAGEAHEAVRVQVLSTAGAQAIVQGSLREGDRVSAEPASLLGLMAEHEH